MNRRAKRMITARLRQGDERALAQVELIQEVLRRTDDIQYVAELERENREVHGALRQSEECFQRLDPACNDMPERLDLYAQVVALRKQVAELEAQRLEIETLPRDLSQVIALVARLYADRIAFTESATQSAKVAQCQDADVAWRLLRGMALFLPDLYSEDVDIAREFRARSGFELALTESSATKQMPELMRLRMVRVGNMRRFAQGHVKYGTRAPRLLRVHFVVHPLDSCIVVSHCGDHLETAGTRRMS